MNKNAELNKLNKSKEMYRLERDGYEVSLVKDKSYDSSWANEVYNNKEKWVNKFIDSDTFVKSTTSASKNISKLANFKLIGVKINVSEPLLRNLNKSNYLWMLNGSTSIVCEINGELKTVKYTSLLRLSESVLEIMKEDSK